MCWIESFYLLTNKLLLPILLLSPAVNWSSCIVNELIELCICRVHIFSSVFKFFTEITSLKMGVEWAISKMMAMDQLASLGTETSARIGQV